MHILDQLLNRLDQQWASGEVPNVASLIAELPPDEADNAVELCAADLEWRWRSGGVQPRCDDAARAMPPKPHACDYQPLLAERWLDVDCQRNLLEAEWCARSIWGDTPDVDAFFLQQPNIKNWKQRLGEQLNALAPLVASVSSQFLPRPLNAVVDHQFVIGRQSKGEPPAPAWIGTSRRLIVAGLHYRVISRKQLRVRRTRLHEVELCNVSKVIGGSWAGQVLGPGESTRLSLPMQIQIGAVVVTIESEKHELKSA